MRLGMLSSLPPTACGIASFAAALSEGLGALGVDLVHVDAGCGTETAAFAALGAGTDEEIEVTVEALAECDAVIVQHEYGIFPGLDGSGVLDVVESIRAPVIVVAHTVLSEPTRRQHAILVELCAAATVVVVMTNVARDRLIQQYGVDETSVVVIPHGAAVDTDRRRTSDSDPTGVRMLTWGLLGPGKGIEWAIEAFARIELRTPAPQYVIAGSTHPNVKARDGERYRRSLEQLAVDLGVDDRVMFDDTYRTVAELGDMIAGADLIVLPYDSPDQVTSGVLVDAVAAGRPVLSTAFPHAVELLHGGGHRGAPAERRRSRRSDDRRSVRPSPGCPYGSGVPATRPIVVVAGRGASIRRRGLTRPRSPTGRIMTGPATARRPADRVSK